MAHLRMRVLASGEAPPPERVLAALPPEARPALLDTSDGSGWSLLAWQPDRWYSGLLSAGRGIDPCAGLGAGEIWSSELAEPFLWGGWLGYFGFECGHAYEVFPWVAPDPAGFPDYAFGRYRQAIAWPPRGPALFLYAEEDQRRPPRGVLAQWRAALAAPPLERQRGWLPLLPQPRWPASRYQHAVASARARIGAGDYYQVNLAHPFAGPGPDDPRLLYCRLRQAQPTARSAYFELGQGRVLLSWSPETFLTVAGPQLESRPIKGTAARGQAQALENSTKERAELTMIVDMVRNDLGRVAVPGGVSVVTAGVTERLPSLHHRVATVRARWDPEQGLPALWRAAFPPASVTGAPKVAALRAIAELEGEARGPYCGAFGAWLPGEPRGAFSVLIRTALLAGGRLSFRAGAGIVWDSDPQREWEETLLKARFLQAALAPDPQPSSAPSAPCPPP